MGNLKKRIIVCGYPKSGNTWLARLTAELVECPVKGFWCEPFNNEIAVEGSNRESEFSCFKAHHSIDELEFTLEDYGNGTEKIIYIIRDPRDVSISAMKYFWFPPRYPRIRRMFSWFSSKGILLYKKYFEPEEYRLKYIINGIVNGMSEGAWLHYSWGDHVRGYVNSNKDNILIVKYEDLLNNVAECAEHIVDFIGITKSRSEILNACKAQSFSRKKAEFKTMGDQDRANFMRTGKSGQWAELFDDICERQMSNAFADLYQRLGYE